MSSTTVRSIIVIIAVLLVAAGTAGASEVYVPITGHGTGVALYNTGSQPALAALAVLDPLAGSSPIAHTELVVAPGEAWRSDAIVDRMLGGTPVDGLLRVAVDGRLIVTAWQSVENPATGSHDRLPIAPWPAGLAASRGILRDLVVSGESAATANDRVALIELAGQRATVRLTAYDPDGVSLSFRTVELTGGELRAVPLTELAGSIERPARISVEVFGDGRVLVAGRALTAAVPSSAPVLVARTPSPHDERTPSAPPLPHDAKADEEAGGETRGTAADVDGDGDVDSADVSCVTATVYDAAYGCAVATGSGDITAVYAGEGLSGGGTTGDVTLDLDVPLVIDDNMPSLIVDVDNSGGNGISGTSTLTNGIGVVGGATTGTGVQGAGHRGVHGYSGGSGGIGVLAEAPGSTGIGLKAVGGTGSNANGVLAVCDDGPALAAQGTNGIAINALGGGYGLNEPVARLRSNNSGGVGLHVDATTYNQSIVVDNDNANGDFADFRADDVSRFKVGTNGATFISSTASGLTGSALQLENTNSAGIALWAHVESTDAAAVISNEGTGHLLKMFHSGDLRFVATNAGNVFIDGAYYSGGADFAEMIPARETGLAAGDVVALAADGRLVRTTETEQGSVVGVVSTEPGYLGDYFTDVADDEKVPLAVVGIVPVKVTASAGPIRPGDMLTPSAVPGRAMRARNPRLGTVIGKAMQPLEAGDGLILALISPR